MQVYLAFSLLASVLAGQYGYYLAEGTQLVEPRVAHALTGVQLVAMSVAIGVLALRRVTDWRAALMLIFACSISLGEALMQGVCGSWYAFAYVGPRIDQDLCEAMTGWSIAAPTKLALCAWFSLYIFAGWRGRQPGDAYSPDGVFVGYARPCLRPWKLAALMLGYPWSGRVWIVRGQGLRFERKSGCLVAFDANPDDYKLKRLERAPLIYPGLPWRWYRNCAWGLA